MNQALLGKWLWRIGKDGLNLWKNVLLAKYGALRNRWDAQGPNSLSSRLWRRILSSKEGFYSNITIGVRSGERVFFFGLIFGMVIDPWQRCFWIFSIVPEIVWQRLQAI